MTAIIDAYRSVLLMASCRPRVRFMMATAVSLATLAVAWLVFHRAEFRFAENI